MATYKLKRFSNTGKIKQKIFFLNPLTGEPITGKELLEYKKNNGGNLKNAFENVSMDKAVASEQATAQRAAERAANKANATGVKNAAMRARTQGYNAGMKAGQSSVGLKTGAMNTWNKMGTMGKVGTVGAAVGGTYLLGKGLGLWGNKKKEA